MYFAYSYHRTIEAAQIALENYFAEGIICEGERPRIEWCAARKRYAVMFPG